MLAKLLVALSATLAGTPSLVSAAGNANGNVSERVLGVYIFHRHGDRTAKAWAPVTLTALGAAEVFSSADFYRQRYVQSDAALRISGLADTLTLSQLSITAPKDAVLYNSALTFTQGMYPPAGQKESLANGSQVEAPLGGYQYVPVDAISNAATVNKAESQGWLQGSSGCDKSVASSNSYLSTPAYKETYNDTLSFYQRLLPVINSTYGADAATFKNGYTSRCRWPGKTQSGKAVLTRAFFRSLRLHQCRQNPQRNHPLGQPRRQRDPIPPVHTRLHPRMESRLQRQRAGPSHRRPSPRRPGPRLFPGHRR